MIHGIDSNNRSLGELAGLVSFRFVSFLSSSLISFHQQRQLTNNSSANFSFIHSLFTTTHIFLALFSFPPSHYRTGDPALVGSCRFDFHFFPFSANLPLALSLHFLQVAADSSCWQVLCCIFHLSWSCHLGAGRRMNEWSQAVPSGSLSPKPTHVVAFRRLISRRWMKFAMLMLSVKERKRVDGNLWHSFLSIYRGAYIKWSRLSVCFPCADFDLAMVSLPTNHPTNHRHYQQENKLPS